MADRIGGGVAPGRRGSTVSQTSVRRIPYWVPWDHGGSGSWRLLPADTAHDQQMVTRSNEGDRAVKSSEPLYQAKGFVPERFAPKDKLPLLVELAQSAIRRASGEMLPAPDWALGVLGRYPELVSKPKAAAGADAA